MPLRPCYDIRVRWHNGWPPVIGKEGSIVVSCAAKLSRAAKLVMVDKSETRMFKVRSPEESRAEESGPLEKAERDAKLKTEHTGHNVGLDGGGHTGGSSLFTHLFCCADPEDSGATVRTNTLFSDLVKLCQLQRIPKMLIAGHFNFLRFSFRFSPSHGQCPISLHATTRLDSVSCF